MNSAGVTPALVAVGLSAIVTGLNGASRAIVQHRLPVRQDFYFGIGLVLAAFGTDVTNLSKGLLRPDPPSIELLRASLLEALALGPLLTVLVVNMLFQQEIERRLISTPPKGTILIGWIANSIGFGAMVGVLYLGVRGQ